MQSIYKVARIEDAQIDRTYVLVNRIAPAVTLEEWRASCRKLIGRTDRRADQDDVAVATNPLGYVQGLSISAVRRHLIYGRILEVSVLAVASAADEAGVADDLLRYLKALAEAEACDGIRVWTLGQDDWTLGLAHPEIDRSHHGALMVFNQQATIGA
jgi:hypothetical protein